MTSSQHSQDIELDDIHTDAHDMNDIARTAQTVPQRVQGKSASGLSRLIPGRDGIRTLLIERVHYLLTIPVFIVYAIIIIIGLFVGIFAAPETFTIKHSGSILFPDGSHAFLPDLNVLNGTKTLSASTTEPLNDLNQQLRISLSLYKHHFWHNLTVNKYDLNYNVAFYGKKQKDTTVKFPLNVAAIPHRAALICPEHKDKCNNINIAFTDLIRYPFYEVEVTLRNADELVVDLTKTLFPQQFNHSRQANSTGPHLVSMLRGEASFTFFTYNAAFSNWELGWRYTLIIFSVPFTVFYFVYTFALTEFKNWTMEQWWVGGLLLLLNLYNNPLYALEIYDTSFLLTFLNTVFVSLFICYMLLTVLIMVHGAIKRPQDRSLLFFYVPKILLVATVYMVLLFFFIFAAFRSSLDPAYSAFDDVSGNTTEYEYLGVFLLVALLIYALSLLYYTFRGIGMWRRGSLQPTRRNRFWIIFFFTLVMLAFTAFDALSLIWRVGGTTSGQFLIFFLIYNGYTLIMGIFHLPTLRLKKKEDFSLEENAIAHEEDIGFYAELEEDETIADNTYADFNVATERDADDADDVEEASNAGAAPEVADNDNEDYDSFQENQL